MEKPEFEFMVLEVVKRAAEGRPTEDNWLELKSEWPSDTAKAARQLAGLANASRGHPVTWIIGVDQKARKVTGAKDEEADAWYRSVSSYFDHVAPDLSMHLNVPTQYGATVVAMQFLTERAPYLIKALDRLEVPWREAGGTRSATRADLLTVLVPQATLPVFEVLRGRLLASSSTKEEKTAWHLSLKLCLYAEILGGHVVAVPFHRSRALLSFGDGREAIPLRGLALETPMRYASRRIGMWDMPDENASLTISATHDEMLIAGPGRMFARADANLEAPRLFRWM